MTDPTRSTGTLSAADHLPATHSDFVSAARRKAFLLYEGRVTPHRSCGIALAETFGLPSASYQTLRRGGITGHGECGAVVAGRLVLGELLGDPSPTGAVTTELRAAMAAYDAEIGPRLHTAEPWGDRIACDRLTARFDTFLSDERLRSCTNIAADVAESVAIVLDRLGRSVTLTPIEGAPDAELDAHLATPSPQ
ncbi:MAG: hypothetical protein IV100_15005 [Myxococcales bacterium]|nr:hypothetical protein [Myxococcales bacterium]